MLNPEYPTLPPRKFVGLKSEMDAIIAKYTQSGNDWRILRDELSLGENTDLSNDEITYITVEPGDERFKYDIPNGREGGAYDGEWIPGGKTKGGITEAALINSETVVHNNSLEELSSNFESTEKLQSDEDDKKMELHKVACFKKNVKGTEAEYDRQLKGQQDGINNMTVRKYLDNREAYKKIGRKGTGAAQKKSRDRFKDKLTEKYENELLESNEDLLGDEAFQKAEELAALDMKTLNALHNPDMIAGGNDYNDELLDLGDASVNQSIGSQWKNKGVNDIGDKESLSRVEAMDAQAKSALEELGPDAMMNVNLHRCK
ncbi:polymorphic toxin type 15 domain-containing protein [Pseudoalteromonas sp. SR43-5]|uniref:polymorphic toxin type 15 domain-containing protein n=1 Tax=Pseudoalteromonas sp. SR43-5 TaxID=2760941 RepID=UPI002175D221|nr:polymorphic toxin type 15 domain-containing protein [Pseudoalteromonas sp. SR43-5]